jgi:hypothetical protein
MTAMVNVYQFNDFEQPDGTRHPFTEYYHAARIPALELIDLDIVAIAEYLILASYTSVWYKKKMRPMRAEDLIVITDHGRIVGHVYRIAARDGWYRLPQFTHLSLDLYHLPQKEYEHDAKHDLAVFSGE